MRAAQLALALLALPLAMSTAACGEDDRPNNWTYVHAAIIVPNCTTSSCHGEFNAQAGVRLADRENAYNILVGRTCNENPDNSTDGNFVIPGEPENSRLMYLLIGDNVTRSMPPDRLLPDPDINLIERWILAGAACD